MYRLIIFSKMFKMTYANHRVTSDWLVCMCCQFKALPMSASCQLHCEMVVHTDVEVAVEYLVEVISLIMIKRSELVCFTLVAYTARFFFVLFLTQCRLLMNFDNLVIIFKYSFVKVHKFYPCNAVFSDNVYYFTQVQTFVKVSGLFQCHLRMIQCFYSIFCSLYFSTNR